MQSRGLRLGVLAARTNSPTSWQRIQADLQNLHDHNPIFRSVVPRYPCLRLETRIGGCFVLLAIFPHIARLSHRRSDVIARLAVLRSLSAQPRGRSVPGVADPGPGQRQKDSRAAAGARIGGTARSLSEPGAASPLRAGVIRLS